MAKACWYSSRVLKKAVPALLVIFLVFISAMLLAASIESFFLVFILWIALPVLFLYIYRKIRDRISGD